MKKPLFLQRSSKTVKVVLCVVASLVLLALEKREGADSLRSPLATVAYPIQRLVSAPTRTLHDLIEDNQRQTSLQDENQTLRQEILLLQGRQLQFEALERENIRLRGLLESSFKVGDQVLIAEPLSISLNPFEQMVSINKGSRFGVFRGQAVVDAHGIVGQVLRVTPYSADVVMITDPDHALPVQVNRTGLRTIATGTGSTDRLDLPYLPVNADVKEGDLLVSSGLGGVFPSGYPVAKISRINPEGGNSAGKISAIPLATLDRNHELLLVWSNTVPVSRAVDSAMESLPKPVEPHAGH